MNEFDLLIVGQGLAGTTLALQARRRGLRPLVVNDDARGSASKISAGLVTPVTGQRLTLSWRLEELFAIARTFYQEEASRLATSWWIERPAIRIFTDNEAHRQWVERLKKTPEVAAYASYPQDLPEEMQGFVAPHQAARLSPSARLRVGNYLTQSRLALLEQGAFLAAHFDWESIRDEEPWLVWRDIRARAIISCEGAHAFSEPTWSFLPARPAHGDILTIYAPQLVADATVHGGVFFQPLTQAGYFKVGATYHWDRTDWLADPCGREEIESKLRALINVDYKVMSHDAGVRPVIEGRIPVIGRHPQRRGLYCFNGLASKGSLWAPYFAKQLIEAIFDGSEIGSEVDLANRLLATGKRARSQAK